MVECIDRSTPSRTFLIYFFQDTPRSTFFRRNLKELKIVFGLEFLFSVAVQVFYGYLYVGRSNTIIFIVYLSPVWFLLSVVPSRLYASVSFHIVKWLAGI